MEHPIVLWRIDASDAHSLSKFNLPMAPTTLDDATRQLPGGGYSTLRTYGRYRVLRLEDHFTRLEETARLIGKPVALDRKIITRALHQALTDYPWEQARVRLILGLEHEPGTVFLLLDRLQVPDETDYQFGVKVVTWRLQRDNPKAKQTSFIQTAAAIRQNLPPGVNEAVMVGDNGCLLEGLSSNFFVVKDGTVWTAEQGVLSGITRSLVLQVIRDEAIPLRLEGIPCHDRALFEEAFITSASRAVLPVTHIDGERVGDGRPGPVTRQIMQAYWTRLESELMTI